VTSIIEKTREEVVTYILRNRIRQRVADVTGLHLNTVSDIVSGRRKTCNTDTLIKLEAAVNQIKETKESQWYYGGPK
jgi:hypothetical protein